MLVIHWSKQNNTSKILSNGISPSKRKNKNIKGIYVFPFLRNKTLTGNWRRNLKTWDNIIGNCNGYIFKLSNEDFPLYAGYWFFNRTDPHEAVVESIEALSAKYGDFFSGYITNKTENGIPYNWDDFEIIIPNKIASKKIIKIVRDKEPKNKKA